MEIYLAGSIKGKFDETITLANEQKFNLEICQFADPALLDSNYKQLLDNYKKSLKKYDGKITTHGSFMDLNPASKDQRIVEITKKRYKKNIEVAKELNASTIVFHSGYNGLVKNSVYKYKFIEKTIDFWKTYIKNFENTGIIAALENTYEEKPEILLEIIKEVNSPNLKYCIDTGHVNINSRIPLDEWIEATGTYLHHMHLHNNNGDFDDHASLKSGTLNFEKMVDTLNKLNLNPNLVLEIFDFKDAMKSFEYIKEIKEKVLI